MNLLCHAAANLLGGFLASNGGVSCMTSVELTPGDIVAIAGAAGGVGTIAVQLAKRSGTTVLGIAGSSNDEWLAAHGVIPVNYGDGLADRLRAAAPDGRVDALLDFFGGGCVENHRHDRNHGVDGRAGVSGAAAEVDGVPGPRSAGRRRSHRLGSGQRPWRPFCTTSPRACRLRQRLRRMRDGSTSPDCASASSMNRRTGRERNPVWPPRYQWISGLPQCSQSRVTWSCGSTNLSAVPA